MSWTLEETTKSERGKVLKEYLKKQANYQTVGSIAQKTRNKRMHIFNDYFEKVVMSDHKSTTEKIKILDVGGVPEYWKYLGFKHLDVVLITSLNLEITTVPNDLKGIITSVKGNAVDMNEFDDQSFDLVFSNSVIEHVGSNDNQRKMADEVKRVAKHGFIQTPNKYFFMEPHFLFPFFQFLPEILKTELVYKFCVGHYQKANSRIEARSIVKSIDLLSLSQLKHLFPMACVTKERWLGMTKSYILRW